MEETVIRDVDGDAVRIVALRNYYGDRVVSVRCEEEGVGACSVWLTPKKARKLARALKRAAKAAETSPDA